MSQKPTLSGWLWSGVGLFVVLGCLGGLLPANNQEDASQPITTNTEPTQYEPPTTPTTIEYFEPRELNRTVAIENIHQWMHAKLDNIGELRFDGNPEFIRNSENPKEFLSKTYVIVFPPNEVYHTLDFIVSVNQSGEVLQVAPLKVD